MFLRTVNRNSFFTLSDKISIEDFDNEVYDFRITGPNGFYRHFVGSKKNPPISIKTSSEQSGLVSKKLTGNLIFSIENKGMLPITIQIVDNKYKTPTQIFNLKSKVTTDLLLNLSKNAHWYDFSIVQPGNTIFKHRYAGKIETGEITITDPFMGGVVEPIQGNRL